MFKVKMVLIFLACSLKTENFLKKQLFSDGQHLIVQSYYAVVKEETTQMYKFLPSVKKIHRRL